MYGTYMSQRFEMRLSDELVERIDRARGDVPRATWIKKALSVTLRQAEDVGSSVGPALRDLPADVLEKPRAVSKAQRLEYGREVMDRADVFRRATERK